MVLAGEVNIICIWKKIKYSSGYSGQQSAAISHQSSVNSRQSEQTED